MGAQGSTQKKLFLIKVLKTGVVWRKISDHWVAKESYIAVFIREFYARKPVQCNRGPACFQKN
jgi:hypothetical protein